MAAMPELLRRLAEREKERVATEREARARIRSSRDQVLKASEELRELKRAHEQELRVLKAQYEKHLRDTMQACRLKVVQAWHEQTEEEAAAEQAEKRMRMAEAYASALGKKIADLQVHLQRRAETADKSLACLERFASERVKLASAQCQSRLTAMREHAQKVCASSGAAVEQATRDCQDHLANAHYRAEGRTRLKELCYLAKCRGDYDLSSEAYFGMKADLLTFWQAQARVLNRPRSQNRRPVLPAVAAAAPDEGTDALASTASPTVQGKRPSQWSAAPHLRPTSVGRRPSVIASAR